MSPPTAVPDRALGARGRPSQGKQRIHPDRHTLTAPPQPPTPTPTTGRAAFAEPPSAARSWAGLRTARPSTAAAAGEVALAAATAAPKQQYNLGLTPVVESAEALALTSTRGGAAPAAGNDGLKQSLKVGSFFFLWYLFNIGYNIYNKKALNALPLPWTVGLIQLSLGLLYVFPLWLFGLRKVRAGLHTLEPV